jgi:hypothetical protein
LRPHRLRSNDSSTIARAILLEQKTTRFKLRQKKATRRTHRYLPFFAFNLSTVDCQPLNSCLHDRAAKLFEFRTYKCV